MSDSGMRAKLRSPELEQLALLDPPPVKLTDRQAVVHEALTRNGQDGLTADEAGALWCAAKGIHGPDDRCGFDGKAGLGILHELQAKSLTVYRRANRARGIAGAWLATNLDANAADDLAAADASFGEFPEGF